MCLVMVLGSLAACRRSEIAAEPAPPPAPLTQVTPSSAHGHAHAPPLGVCETRGLDPLSAARRYYDEEKFDRALSCASQATALSPELPDAHLERAAAFAAMGRFEEAQLSYARALALDPDHLDALLGAAHLFGVSLSSSRERDELASTYAERGLALALAMNEASLVSQFALISAMAFNDLGEAKLALERAEQVLSLQSKHPEATYERAVALFELCRFREAKAAFTALMNDPERSAQAHHHLGLLLEREGHLKQAERHLGRARALQPEDFPVPQPISPEEFKREVAKAAAELPEDMRRDLEGIPVEAEELPQEEDLVSGDPPLSPSILGLFRGPPLGEPCSEEVQGPCRSVVLYRRNLSRAVRSREELLEQIRVTLLHEVGHLRGEDDHELAARGLE